MDRVRQGGCQSPNYSCTAVSPYATNYLSNEPVSTGALSAADGHTPHACLRALATKTNDVQGPLVFASGTSRRPNFCTRSSEQPSARERLAPSAAARPCTTVPV